MQLPILALALAAAPAAAQGAVRPPAFPDKPVFADSDALGRAGIALAQVQSLELPAAAGAPFETRLQLHGAEVTLRLAPSDVRAPGFRVWAAGEDGLEPVEVPAPRTYRGEVVNYPGSVVAASLVDGQLEGVLRLGPDLPWMGVQPVSEYDAAAPRELHWIYEAEDAVVGNVGCGVEHAFADDETAHQHGAGTGPQALGISVEAEIAIDADFEFYQENGSDVLETELDIEKVMNGVSAIYEEQFGLRYRITEIIVRTSSNDPYSTSNAGSLLNQLRNHWTGQQGSIQRDQTHLFTGKELFGSTIGIAYLNSICGNNNGYGLSQSRFTGGISSRVALTAHELGHNWNGVHCDGQSTCSIMCSGLGGCTGNITSFGNSAQNNISNKITFSNCIDPPAAGDAPQLTGANPGTIDAFRGGELVLTGDDLIGATEVRIGTTVIPESKLEVGFSQLRITDAVLSDGGLQEAQVTTPGGTAGGVFVDVVPETGFNYEAPLIGVAGQPFELEWSGGPDNLYFVVVASTVVTAPVQGFDLLLGNVILAGAFGSGGAAGFYLDDVGSVPPLLTLYTQLWVIDSGSLQLDQVSNTVATIFL